MNDDSKGKTLTCQQCLRNGIDNPEVRIAAASRLSAPVHLLVHVVRLFDCGL